MPPIKKTASSVANSNSATTFGGTTLRGVESKGGRVQPAEGHVDAGGVVSRKSMSPGGGGRFEAFVGRLVAEGRTTQQAKGIAASAGRKKYGAAGMARMAAKAKP